MANSYLGQTSGEIRVAQHEWKSLSASFLSSSWLPKKPPVINKYKEGIGLGWGEEQIIIVCQFHIQIPKYRQLL